MSTDILSIAIWALSLNSGERLSNFPSSIKSMASLRFGNISESRFSGLIEPSPPNALTDIALMSLALVVFILASLSVASVSSLGTSSPSISGLILNL